MSGTFANQLRNFAYAVDLVDSESFMAFRDLVMDYTRRVLNIDFTRHLVLAESDGEQALLPYGLSKEGKFTSVRMYNDDHTIKTQAAYCFIKNSSLWIVSDEPGVSNLNKCNKHKDLWRQAEGIPRYRYPRGEKLDVPIQTSILIPLRQSEKPIGVINFETQEHLEITAAAKSELKLIADAVSILYVNMLNHGKSVARTGKAISELNDVPQQPLPKLTKPMIFLASSLRAKGDIIEIIKKILKDRYYDKLSVVYWKDMSQPGNINSHLLEVLGKCRYGICYLSEPVIDTDTYRDNPNVIFEAGMLHGRSDFGQTFLCSWIPVREENSEVPPFDLTSERMVIVKRDSSGEIIDTKQLKKLLIKRLDSLLQNR